MDQAVEQALDADTDAATAAAAEVHSLKDGDVFLVADSHGDVGGVSDGLFDHDTRILSHFRLLVGERPPAMLSHSISKDNAVFTFHGANRVLPPVSGGGTLRGAIHIERKRILFRARMHERVRCTNFGLDLVLLPLAFEYAADFRDMFEVRGAQRPQRGTLLEPEVTGRQVTFAYDGLDGVRRTGVLAFSEPPWRMEQDRADFMFTLAPGDHADLYIEAGADDRDPPSQAVFDRALAGARRDIREREARGACLRCGDQAFAAWLDQSRADVSVLVTDLPAGSYPYAGIPWFSTPFGRDGIWTSWQMLWLDPSLARGVLSYLASQQAQETSRFRDSQPGKIMHETRAGEMAALNEIPFGLYYGGVDTTPLFVALAGAYLKRTDDVALISRLWPALTQAADWVVRYGDSNGDGLIDYQRGAETGLSNQGWKDSADSVFHADGCFPASPIALVEVQGYAFAAFKAMARMVKRLDAGDARPWAARAEEMRRKVEARFWMEDDGYYGLAVDGEGELCTPHASNAGHLLFVGLPEPARAARVMRRLMSRDFDTGWGLRTLATDAVRFNPMSYHNGSIWPHDTSICVAGMARYGEREGPAKVICDVFDAAQHLGMHVPELLCGFHRRRDEPPVAYPVACMPQAWAAGAIFLMLQACLGLSIDAAGRHVRLVRPKLPAAVDHLSIEDLDVGGAKLSFTLRHRGDSVLVERSPDSDRDISLIVAP